MLERRSPIPPGRYWLDVFGPRISEWDAWRTANRATVRVASSEYFDSTPPRQWVLFAVSTPTPWDSKRFGYPTVVSQGAAVSKTGTPVDTGVTSSSDTVDRPAPSGGLFDALSTPGATLGAAMPFIALGIALWLATKKD